MSLPIGFFTPLPLPIMIPFMFMQSAAMALAFGSNFQYGKRKISSMSNEDFNKMSALDMNVDLANTVTSMIPSVEQSFRQMEKMNVTILDSMARYFAQAIEFGFNVLTGKQAIQGTDSHFDVGHVLENLTDPFGPNSDTQLSPEDISGLRGAAGSPPPAAVVKLPTITYNANERWAQRWLNPQKKIANLASTTFQEISFLLKLRADGKLFPKWSTLGTILLREYNVKKPIPKTQDDTPAAILASGASGNVKRIATEYSAIVKLLGIITSTKARASRDPRLASGLSAAIRQFRTMVSKFNIFVQGIRKTNLAINADKSIQSGRVIPK